MKYLDYATDSGNWVLANFNGDRAPNSAELAEIESKKIIAAYRKRGYTAETETVSRNVGHDLYFRVIK